MAKTGRWYRWIVGLAGAGALLQVGSCGVDAGVTQQFVVPAISSILSDIIFFTLDSALVHLTT
jgi:hypothetical protein